MRVLPASIPLTSPARGSSFSPGETSSSGAPAFTRSGDAQRIPILGNSTPCHVNSALPQRIGQGLVGKRLARVFLVDQFAQHGLDGGRRGAAAAFGEIGSASWREGA